MKNGRISGARNKRWQPDALPAGFTRTGQCAAIAVLCENDQRTGVNEATNCGHGFCNVLFNHLTSPLEIRIMKIHLLVISAFLALTVSACDNAAKKAAEAKAQADKVATEASQKADEAAKKTEAAVGAAADATKEAGKDAVAATKEAGKDAVAATKEAGKDAVAATKEAGKEMVGKAADATKDAADKTKAAVGK